MERETFIPFVVTALFAIAISVFSFSLMHYNALKTETEKISAYKEEALKSRVDAVTNNIENNINSDAAEVNNTINNSQENNDTQIDNDILNNINVSVDVTVTNDINNQADNENTDKDQSDSNSNSNGNDEQDGTTDEGEIIWGVDSASLTTPEMISCVRENFGDPQIWGRYLGEKEGVSTGLTSDEVEVLHSNEIQILVIWNHFTDATGYENGRNEARQAIDEAATFGIPEGVALFADIEPGYPVDSQFILGWSEAMENSGYTPGIYGVFDSESDLYRAFEEAVVENERILETTYIWTAAPNVGITTESAAPDYQPEAPADALVGGWQYGIDGQACNIDTNLFDGNVTDVLW